MDDNQAVREKRYRVSMMIVKSMLENGIIDEDDYLKMDELLIRKFGSILYGLYPENNLIQSQSRGNMSAEKKHNE